VFQSRRRRISYRWTAPRASASEGYLAMWTVSSRTSTPRVGLDEAKATLRESLLVEQAELFVAFRPIEQLELVDAIEGFQRRVGELFEGDTQCS
jgi:hypothetical protein